MKRTLLILITLFTASLYAQDLGDTLHVAHYDLQLDIRDFSTKIIYGDAQLTVIAKQSNLNQITLDLAGLTVDSAFVGGQQAAFTQQGEKMRISTPTLQLGDTVAVRVCYHGTPFLPGMAWGGIHYSGQYCYNIGVDLDYQPHVIGRVWFPCLDVFTDKSTYTLHVRTEAGKRAVCGGMLTDSLMLADSSRLWTWDMTDPIPTYLASVAVGDYRLYADTFHGMERIIPIQIYAQPTTINKVAGSFVHLKDILRMYERLFGPYRWQRVGYVAVNFNSGAMEHATNIAYPNAAITGGTEYEQLYAHELFHHWFGDLITCRQAEEMWINEGFATYSEALVAGLVSDNYSGYIRDKHHEVLQQLASNDEGHYALDNVPQNHTYGMHSYDKGSLIVHTLRNYLGDSLFFSGMRSLLNHYAFQNVSSPELFNYLSQKTGVNLTAFYEGWVHQPGFPHFSIDSIIPLSGNQYRIYLHQKLHHASQPINNNRMDLTFVSEQRQLHTIPNVTFSGEFGHVDVNIPFTPAFGMVDYAEKITDAVIDYTRSLTNGISWSPTDADCTFRLESFPDTILVRIEHNLVTPDVPDELPAGIYKMANTHYWTIGMAYNTAINTIPTGYIQFRYRRGFEGQLDYEWFDTDYDISQIKLLYRENASMPWRVIHHTRTGSMLAGYIKTAVLQPGQYCLAVGDANANVADIENHAGWHVYPSPVADQLNILIQGTEKPLRATLTDSTGRTVMVVRLKPGSNTFDVHHLASGVYFLNAKCGEQQLTKKIVKK